MKSLKSAAGPYVKAQLVIFVLAAISAAVIALVRAKYTPGQVLLLTVGWPLIVVGFFRLISGAPAEIDRFASPLQSGLGAMLSFVIATAGTILVLTVPLDPPKRMHRLLAPESILTMVVILQLLALGLYKRRQYVLVAGLLGVCALLGSGLVTNRATSPDFWFTLGALVVGICIIFWRFKKLIGNK